MRVQAAAGARKRGRWNRVNTFSAFHKTDIIIAEEKNIWQIQDKKAGWFALSPFAVEKINLNRPVGSPADSGSAASRGAGWCSAPRRCRGCGEALVLGRDQENGLKRRLLASFDPVLFSATIEDNIKFFKDLSERLGAPGGLIYQGVLILIGAFLIFYSWSDEPRRR